MLDSFAGSGTVNVEVILLDRPSINIDPFTHFLIKAKTTKMDSNLERVPSTIRACPNKFDGEIPVPDFPNAEHWFAPHILHELAYINHIIQTTSAETTTRNFLLAVFSSIIRTVSNANNRSPNTAVRKRQNKPVRERGVRYDVTV